MDIEKTAVILYKTKHPNLKDHGLRYDNLIGISTQKDELLMTLAMFLDKDRIGAWLKKHHKGSLPYLSKGLNISPLILLSGEVGCGKTELAQTIGTPLAELLDTPIISLLTPSDIRGTGLVGELSARITSAFNQAKNEVGKDAGLLIIDEADDLATSRNQDQAHHEDRAGVNALIKEIDNIERGKIKLAIILITNRADSLDAAVTRRACLELKFTRPSKNELKEIFEVILNGTSPTETEIDALIDYATKKKVPYSYSDLLQRIGKQAIIQAFFSDSPFNAKILLEILMKSEPTPLIISHGN